MVTFINLNNQAKNLEFVDFSQRDFTNETLCGYTSMTNLNRSDDGMV